MNPGGGCRVIQWVHDIVCGGARVDLQLAREVSWAEIDSLTDEKRADLLTQADIRKANDLTRWQ